MCIIFPHVPKCGGTTLYQQLEQSDKKVFFDYDKSPNANKFHAKGCARRNWEFSLLDFRMFDVVFGHFPVCRYEKPHYRYVTLLRHPVERAVSQYFYWKNQVPDNNLRIVAMEPIISGIKSGQVGFLDFLQQQDMAHFYHRYLGEKRPDEYELVGFTDAYESFCSRLSEMLGLEVRHDIQLRKGEKSTIPQHEQDKAEQLLGNEISLYHQFRDYWRGRS